MNSVPHSNTATVAMTKSRRRKECPTTAPSSSSAEARNGVARSATNNRTAAKSGRSTSQQQPHTCNASSSNHYYSMPVSDLCDDENNVALSTRQDSSRIHRTLRTSNSVQGDTFYAPPVQVDDDDDDDDDDDCKPAAVKRGKIVSTAATTYTDATPYKPLYFLMASDDDTELDEVDDYAIAVALQKKEDDEDRRIEQLQREALQQMQCSTTGKAWQFVESVLDILKQMRYDDDETSPSAGSGIVTIPVAAAVAVESGSNLLPPSHPKYSIQPLAVNNMVFFAERFLEALAEFYAAGKPTVVDLGYHYTDAENLVSIRTSGLLSKAERAENNIKEAVYHGSSCGDGIYSATDPSSYSQGYGDVGLLVARLPGQDSASLSEPNSDSVTVNRQDSFEFMVLATAKQCLPILQFPTDLIRKRGGLDALKAVHRKVLDLVNATFTISQRTNASMEPQKIKKGKTHRKRKTRHRRKHKN